MIAWAVAPLYNLNNMPAKKVARARDFLSDLHITLSDEQPHISGERELLSQEKMVLMGKYDGKKVVIKISDHPNGIKEIRHDKAVRDMIERMSFATDELLQADEVLFIEQDGHTLLVTEYIEQDRIFVDRPIEEQFFIALRAFEAQEGFHMTTYEHNKQVRDVFECYTPETYLNKFSEFTKTITKDHPKYFELLERAGSFLKENRTVLERYNNHLIHNDFVPHNMRVRGRDLYVLDQTSFWFGNKYEGWARFLNYMTLHNPSLERLLVSHLKTHRSQEYLAVRLMRVYKLAMILEFHARMTERADGDLKTLSERRLVFWCAVLECLLDDLPVPEELVEGYTRERDTLRSAEEKKRQQEFARV